MTRERRRRLLAAIVADLGVLRAAYGKAGLLAEPAPGGVDVPGDGDHFRRDFLLLDAVVRNRVAWLVHDGGARRHIAVFGGNNVGKSTVINVIAAAPVASTSPAGGHTRHAHAYLAGTTTPDSLFGDNPHAFAGFAEVAPTDLPAERFDRYARSTAATLPDDIVLWDTPDCDAAGSARYLDAAVEPVAAADLVLYVTSGERYAVDDLVEWVFLLHDAGLPLLECLNKTRGRDRQPVVEAQGRRIFPLVAARLGLEAPAPEIVALRYLAEGEDSDLWGPSHPEAAVLREAMITAACRGDRTQMARQALGFAERRLAAALAPARRERQARQDWVAAVDAAVAGFAAAYEHRYLTSESVIEPFSRLNLAILELLDPDIPGLKETMAAIRWVTRWPARLIMKIGRTAISAVFSDGTAAAAALAPELRAFSDAHVALLARLGRHIDGERDAPGHHPFWDRLGQEWQDQLARLSDAFAAAAATQMQRTDAEIKRAAADIVAALRQRPAILAVLRGARVAGNVGGALVGIVLPHHGMLFDLVEEAVVAPAMISATEAATSAVAEHHVARRKNAIVAILRTEAHDLAETVYAAPLHALAAQAMARAGALGIEDELLERLPARLRQLGEAVDG